MHTSNRWLKTPDKPVQKKLQVTRFRFLLPRVGLILLSCCIVMMAEAQLTYGRMDKVPKLTNKGTVNLSGDGNNLQATLKTLAVSGLPKNAPLVIHIHAKNTTSTALADVCKGPVLFKITAIQSDAQGNFSLQKGDTKDFVLNSDLTDVQKQNLLKASALNTWRLNIHDAAFASKDIDPITKKPKPISVACGALNKNGVATLKVTKIPPGTPTLN